jgi:chemotaxis protein methyltransferase CheR
MSVITITDQEFTQFRNLIHRTAGINMSPAKKALVCGRLSKRLQHRKLATFSEYFRLITSGAAQDEMQIAVDLLTTNETYFFREPKHFEVLRRLATAARGRAESFRVWSAASSSGEEAYSSAMVLADCLEERAWEVTGTDISTRVIESARAGHYVEARAQHVPKEYLRRFCLKGTGNRTGTVLVSRELRGRVNFQHANLIGQLPAMGKFDVIFLRNVMIYFDQDTKRRVVASVLENLKPGGHFMIGHSESLNDISTAVEQIAPSTYRKP